MSLLRKTYIRCFYMVFLLLALYLVWNVWAHRSTIRMNDSVYIPPCSFPDTSFCGTEAHFIYYLSTNDFSDILEAQVPVSVLCSQAPAQPACDGTAQELTIQAFAVQQHSVTTLLTRNQYISFFRSYVEQHGPLHFVSATQTLTGARLHFVDAHHTTFCDFFFTHTNGLWRLTVPSVDAL